MENFISKIANHVYVKDGLEAIKLYKEAFQLEEKNKPWLDDDGLLIHQELQQDGQLFMSISEDKYLATEIRKNWPGCCQPTNMNIVYFSNEEDLRKAFELLHKDGNPSTGLRTEEHSIISCDIIDKFDILWHLCVPKDWSSSFIPK